MVFSGAVRLTSFSYLLSCILTPADSILQAFYEIRLKRGWAVPTRETLDMCEMVEKRMFVFPFF